MNIRRFVRKQISELNYLTTSAKLIWLPAERKTYYDKPQNSYVCFRGRFEIETLPSTAIFRVFADSRYMLYVNGEYITKGPARSDPRWQFYDVIDVAKYLRKGENVVAVMVLYYGYGTGHSIDTLPCFFLDGTAGDVLIQTDKSWVCEKCEAFLSDSPRVNGCKGPCEVFDNRKYQARWMMPDYDDSKWIPVHVREVHRDSPFRNLLARPIPQLIETKINALGVVAMGGGKEIKATSCSHLHLAIKEECQSMAISPVKYELPLKFPARLSTEDVSVLCVDFGKIYAGYLNFNIDGHSGDIIDVIFSEVKTPDLRPFFDGVSYRPISRFILKEGENDLQIFFNYDAMRYAYLILRGENAELRAASVSWTTYPFERMSEFHTDNKSLQKLWDISVHTLRLCMQDGFLDSPSREQQQWMGDSRCQAHFNAYLSGDMRMLRKVLYQFAQSQDYEGMTCSRYPDQNINFAPIPDFCLQWISSFSDYYDFTGDIQPANDLYDHMIRAMRWFTAFLHEDNLVWNLPYWQYYDTGLNALGQYGDFFVGNEGCACAIDNLMLLEATKVMIRFAKLLNDEEAMSFYTDFCVKLSVAIKKAFWSEEKGFMIDCIRPTSRSESVSELANALALLHLFEPNSYEAKSIIEKIFEREPWDMLVRADLYSTSTIVRSLVKHGQRKIALYRTMEQYSEMLLEKTEATSTWETWKLFRYNENEELVWQNSACHAWGASGILIAAELLGGVRYESGKPFLDPVDELVPFDAEFCMPNGWSLVCRSHNGQVTRKLIKK